MNYSRIFKLFIVLVSIILGSFSTAKAQACDQVGFLYIDSDCDVYLIDVFEEQGGYHTIELTACTLPPLNFLNFSADSVSVACTGYPLYSLTCAEIDTASQDCINPDLIDTNMECEDVLAPVCGCDGVTYDNPCEAGAAGVSNFVSGMCDTSSDSLCETTFIYNLMGENMVSFSNTSTDMPNAIWYFCVDGSFDFGETVTHEFPGDGSYIVVMFTFEENCNSASFQIVTIGDTPVMPSCLALDDFVFPGDADDDGFSNMNDLLYLGLGSNQTGYPRPSATTDWYGQMALDWDSWVGDVNGKHLDCDGNGAIEASDISSILKNSTPLPSNVLPSSNDAPPVYLKFDQDTISLTESGDYLVSAELMVGSGQFPIENLYGLSVGISYPNDLIVKPIEMNYNDNSFFGSSNNLFLDAKDFKEAGQVDVGVVKNNQVSVAGYGAVAKLDIIIVEDIISLRVGDVIPVDFIINGIKLIGADGSILDVDVSETNTVVFQNLVASNNSPSLAGKVSIYPSPVKEQLTIKYRDLKPTSIEIYDVLGQILYTQQGAIDENIDVQQWTTGHYILKMNTPEGLVVKKFFKQ